MKTWAPFKKKDKTVRTITISDDKAGRQCLELLWTVLSNNRDKRSRADQRSLNNLLDSIEVATDLVPNEIKCKACGATAMTVSVDMPEQRTIQEGSGGRVFKVEEAEYALALNYLAPERLELTGLGARYLERLLVAWEAAPKDPAP